MRGGEGVQGGFPLPVQQPAAQGVNTGDPGGDGGRGEGDWEGKRGRGGRAAQQMGKIERVWGGLWQDGCCCRMRPVKSCRTSREVKPPRSDLVK